MSNTVKFACGCLLAGVAAIGIGCSKEVPPANPTGETTTAEPKPMPLSDAPDAAPVPPAGDATSGPPADDTAAPATDAAAPATGDQSADDLIKANLASLSAEDRELAMKQKICPVGGGALGSMGTPIKVSVAGHDVFICCDHCEEPLKADPAKHLATIGLLATEAAAK